MKGKKRYSEILKEFPSEDSGKLNHHLKKLQELDLVEKIGDKYRMTMEGEKYGVYINQFQLTEMYPIPVVCIAVVDEEKILLGRRAKKPYLKQWVLPGGKVDVGESIEDACHSEIKEEIGGEIKNLSVYGIYPTVVWSGTVLRNHVYLIGVRAELASEPKGNRNGDLDKFDFFSKDEMENLTISKSNWVMIDDAFEDQFKFKEQVIEL
jgi:ADP-ribose pyrophosphatase YjhB (NUDIX family)